MESIGSHLKKVRQEKKISLEEIKKETKLSLGILRAIEEDRFSDYHPSYIKGFLKIYCKFLGLDPKDYISQYEETLISEKKEEAPPKTPSERIRVFVPLKIDLKTKKIILFSLIILILFFSFFRGVSIYKRLKVSHTKKQIPPSEIKKEDILKEKIPQKKELRIVLKAKEDCWIKVKVDSKIVFQNILKKGKAESWQAEKEIVLDIGNAGGVILEVNDKILSPLGRRGQVIKGISITEEGVSIGR